MSKAKETCRLLKGIRKRVAERYGIPYNPAECDFEGECTGSCPRTEAELHDLEVLLQAKGVRKIDVDAEVQEAFARHNREKAETFPAQGPAILSPDRYMPLHGPESEVAETYGEYEPAPVKSRLLKETRIAGLIYHDTKAVVERLQPGVGLALVRQPFNPADRNAVAVCFREDCPQSEDEFDIRKILGYIPRTENREIAVMMDMGWEDAFRAVVTEVNKSGYESEKVKIAIFVNSRSGQTDRGAVTWPTYIDEEEYRHVEQELFARGCVLFRWGSYTRLGRPLPKCGQRVALLFRRDYDTVIFLMRVSARGRACRTWLPDVPDLLADDDATPFVLTNIHGPVAVPTAKLFFLYDEKIGQSEPDAPLSEANARSLEFRIRLKK